MKTKQRSPEVCLRKCCRAGKIGRCVMEKDTIEEEHGNTKKEPPSPGSENTDEEEDKRAKITRAEEERKERGKMQRDKRGEKVGNRPGKHVGNKTIQKQIEMIILHPSARHGKEAILRKEATKIRFWPRSRIHYVLVVSCFSENRKHEFWAPATTSTGKVPFFFWPGQKWSKASGGNQLWVKKCVFPETAPNDNAIFAEEWREGLKKSGRNTEHRSE